MAARSGWHRWRSEWPLLVALVILLAGWLLKPALLTRALPMAGLGVGFAVFFVGALLAATAATRHAEHLAVRFGEPYGTLMLTLSAITLEIATIATVMLHGDNNPVFARDTMFSVLMLTLNGAIGCALLIGALRHGEQGYNLRGANAFLSLLIPLATLALVWPHFTVSTGIDTLSRPQVWFLIVVSLLLYASFLALQTRIRPGDFREESASAEPREAHAPAVPSPHGWPWHLALLALYLLAVVALSELVALPLDFGIEKFGLAPALGGLAVAALVLAPEGMSAIRAAKRNHMQRAINVSLGTALSTVAMTVPAVLLIDLISDRPPLLGLSPADGILLVLTLAVSMLTFSSGKTNGLQGLVHIVLLLCYIILLFSP